VVLERSESTTEETEMMQHHAIQYVIARDHVDILRREARQARLAKARRRQRSTRRSR
jgi:hypothetical protein